MADPNRRSVLRQGVALLAAPKVRATSDAIVDSHVHVWKIGPRYPFTKQGTLPPPAHDATPEALRALMRGHGVRKAIIVQVSHYGWDHSYLIQTLRRYPRDFVGVARVDPQDPAAPDTLAGLVKAHAIRGLRLNVQPDPAFDWVRGPLMPPLWRQCAALAIPLCLQTKGPRLRDLAPLIRRFDSLDVVIDHMADIALDDQAGFATLLDLAQLPRVHVKLSHTWLLAKTPYPYPDAQARVARLLERYGARRLIFGSDWPGVEKYCPYGRTIDLVRNLSLSAQDRQAILAGNSARLFRV